MSTTTTMKGARFHAAKDVRVEETSVPSPKKNQVKIESEICWYLWNRFT